MWAYPNNNISNHHHQQENDFVLIPSPTQYESSSSQHTHTHPEIYLDNTKWRAKQLSFRATATTASK